MKNVFSLILVLTACFGCLAQHSHELDPADFEKGLDKEKVQILDVRTAGEFQGGHIKNALQADWTNRAQFQDRVSYMNKEKTVYIYCLSGGRSAAAANWMRGQGFEKVLELRGGINAWKREGRPVEGQSNEPQLTVAQYYASLPKDKPVLVDFGADWCPPCIKMKPVIDEVEKKADKKFVVMKIDAGVQTILMKELKIEPIPVFIVYKGGKEVWRKQGLVSKSELLDQLK